MARPRQSGLGPQGHEAVVRAAETLKEMDAGHAPVIGRPNTGPVNPAVTSTPHPGEDENVPDDWWSFDSSRLQEAAYNAQTETLYVRFVKPRPGGTPWVYEGVQPNEWRNLRRSQSPGRFVNRVLNSKNYHKGDF